MASSDRFNIYYYDTICYEEIQELYDKQINEFNKQFMKFSSIKSSMTVKNLDQFNCLYQQLLDSFDECVEEGEHILNKCADTKPMVDKDSGTRLIEIIKKINYLTVSARQFIIKYKKY
ncbi:MAG: hypothetical protein KDH96_09690 [Candidatus Riesia sp.]|nr:hypothetical protein [Candidatus Riesia sp.]